MCKFNFCLFQKVADFSQENKRQKNEKTITHKNIDEKVGRFGVVCGLKTKTKKEWS